MIFNRPTLMEVVLLPLQKSRLTLKREACNATQRLAALQTYIDNAPGGQNINSKDKQAITVAVATAVLKTTCELVRKELRCDGANTNGNEFAIASRCLSSPSD
ncbi:hypothetical protein ACTXT7_012474 [Hymenolepis weldensis]